MNLSSRMIMVLMALFVSLSAVAVLGAGPSTNDPFHAAFIDNQPRQIEANSDLWLKFDYALNGTPRSIVTLTLVGGTQSGVHFEVWAPEVIVEWWEKHPTGRGTATRLDCATGRPSASGECQSNDLTWVGAFGSGGTYYVHVINDNPSPRTFLLTIQGEGVTLGPTATGARAIPTSASIHSSAVTPPPAISLTPRDDPNFAVGIDGQWHSMPGNSVIWYKFNYDATNPVAHPVVHLKLVNGVVSGVGFEIWAPENINNWWEKTPVGRGTQEWIVNCVSQPNYAVTPTPNPTEVTPTPEPTSTPSGKCATNDLTWAGAFGASGTYYVRVVNSSSNWNSYALALY